MALEVRDGLGNLLKVTEREYAFERYPGMKSANMLSQVARTNVLDQDGDYHQSQVTTWNAWPPGDPNFWAPHRTYAWKASGPSASAPSFTAWSAGQTPSSSWERKQTIAAYDAHGHPTETVDARGTSTFLYYGDNTSPLSKTASGLSHAYLTGVDVGGLALERTYHKGWGKAASETGPAGVTRSYEYDAHGRLWRVRDDSGALIKKIDYHPSSNPLEDPSYIKTILYGGSTSPDQVTTQFYDGLGRPIQKRTEEENSRVVIERTQYKDGRMWKLWRPVRVFEW